MRNGRLSLGDSSRTSPCFFRCWASSFCRSGFGGSIFTAGWIFRPGSIRSLDAKHGYLNWEFFLFRAIFFFVALTIVAYLLRRFSVRQDRDGNPQFTIWMRKAAFVGLPLFALCLTFGAFDWLMSLNWHWFSTMWGPYIFAGTAGSSMALLVLVTAALATSRLSARRGHDRALPHHGEMAPRLHRFLGLHRL